jgi:hypothetical protein
VLSYREVEADVPPFGRQQYQFTVGHAVRDAARFLVGLTETLPGVRVVLQLSFFLHNSNFFRQPSSLRVQRSRAAKLEILFVRTTGGTFAETQEKSLADRALR